MRTFTALVALLFVFGIAYADVYMHNPRGSNDRNCETNVNRNNGNRLFDSQNNGKGGYACPRAVGGPEVVTPTMYYYVGSVLRIEWTQQHSCGVGNAYCDIVMQYACEDSLPGLRDGQPKDEADPATDRVPKDKTQSQELRYGYHESYDYYIRCETRQQNTNLFTADRPKINKGRFGEGKPAKYTRQNPNGNRNGFECPEERDYYPYWHWSPWRDIAIYTTNTSRCDWIRENSQNVVSKGECRKSEEEIEIGVRWNTKAKCEENGNYWAIFQPWTLADGEPMEAPECLDAQRVATRDNHLGSTYLGGHSEYNWTIPNTPNDKCVFRLRYNITTTDYPPTDINADYSGEVSPIKQDQFNSLEKGYGWELANAINTNQYGRTFQDRSYVFQIKERPKEFKDATIYNLNVRGKRGNIVQTFPAVEYDYVPQFLAVKGGDYLHIQWTGSDYNPNRAPNDAEGGPTYRNTQQTRADRSNFVQTDYAGLNLARPVEGVSMFKDKDSGDPLTDLAKRLALIDQPLDKTDDDGKKLCLTYQELRAEGKRQNEAERDNRNCGKLNAAPNPYFDAGLVMMTASGDFKYYSSRNNNFSNRSQKGRIVVTGGWWAGAGQMSLSRWALGAVMAVVLAVMGL